MVVDFMLIGAQKCGTTTIASQLASHPDVCFCARKEPGYFIKHKDWRENIDLYHNLFKPVDGQICGEASTMYTFLPEYLGTHERIQAYNPDVKLIYIMRNPVERVISNYSHRVVRRTVRESPDKIVFADPSYINRSRYAVQIKPYLELFGQERIHLLIFEEYVASQCSVLSGIADFLGITSEPFHNIETRIEHSSTGNTYMNPSITRFINKAVVRRFVDTMPVGVRSALKQKIGRRIEEKPVFSPLLRETLWRFLISDVHEIEEIMGRKIAAWREDCVSTFDAKVRVS